MKSGRHNFIGFIGLTFSMGMACGNTEPTDAGPNPAEETNGNKDTNVENPPGDLALTGTYVDDWGTEHILDNDVWIQGSSAYLIISYDNELGVIIAQNDSDNAYNPDLWSRFDWATVDGKLWYCQTAYDAASAEAAQDTAAADASNPAETGCGGFSWTQLSVALAIRGEFDDSWGGDHVITQTNWVNGDSSYLIAYFDNEARFIVAQNSEENEYNPGLWSRFDWHFNDSGLWYCQTRYDAASEQDAIDSPAADTEDGANSGCGGFGWTQLTALGE